MALSPRLPWELAQTKWSSEINPVLALPILKGNQIDSVVLKAGTALAINHLLSRTPQGWFLVDNTADSVIWRTQAFTTTTITLQASADTTISFYIY